MRGCFCLILHQHFLSTEKNMPFAANVRPLWRANENSRKTDVVVVVVVVDVVYLVGSACKTQVYTECRPWNIATKGCDDHENRAQCNMMLKTLQDDIQQTHINRTIFCYASIFRFPCQNLCWETWRLAVQDSWKGPSILVLPRKIGRLQHALEARQVSYAYYIHVTAKG